MVIANALFTSHGQLLELHKRNKDPQLLKTAKSDLKIANIMREASEEGLLQLFFSDGKTPSLKSYEVNNRNPSWMYYGLNVGSGNPYFLEGEQAYKTCHYHIHVLKLMHGLLSRDNNLNVLRSHKPRADFSALKAAYRTYKDRKSTIFKHIKYDASSVNYAACRTSTHLLTEAEEAFYDDL